MPQQTTATVTPSSIDLRPPLPAVQAVTWYLVDAGLPTERFVTGSELLMLPPPRKISAIAWRV